MSTESEDEGLLDITVSGDVIRFMWDYTVSVPLWDREGLLPEEPEWLRQVLGLSEQLVADLSDWGTAMNHLDTNPRSRTDDVAYRDLDRRARTLVDRLQQEVGAHFEIQYRPWGRLPVRQD